MQNNLNCRWILLSISCLLLQTAVYSQTTDSAQSVDATKAVTIPGSKAYKTEKAVVIYLGGGLSVFTGKLGTPSGFDADVSKNHPVGSLRVMWHPGHLLHLGLETGWVRFYSYTIDNNGKKGSTELNATPLLFVLSMPLTQRFHVFAGSGYYFMNSKLNYESEVTSKAYSLGFMLASSYYQPISKLFGLAVEAKYMNATGTKDAVLCLQLQARFKL